MGDSPAYVKFQPNEAFLESLLAMGISENHAHEALFCTGNESVEAAISYVFSNLLQDSNDEGSTEARGDRGVFNCSKSVGYGFSNDEGNLEARGAAAEHGEVENAKRYKMSFVVNTALKMGTGKAAAQVAHACLGLYREMRVTGQREDALNEWDYFGEKKIVLKGENTEQLEELFNKAKDMNIPCYLVSDAGHTQIPAGSVTVLSVFGDEEEVNAITGNLNLL